MRSEQGLGSGRCGRAPEAAVRKQRYTRLQVLWALTSALVLLACWDVALRLDERVSVPRMRLAHVLDERQHEAGQHETGW